VPLRGVRKKFELPPLFVTCPVLSRTWGRFFTVIWLAPIKKSWGVAHIFLIGALFVLMFCMVTAMLLYFMMLWVIVTASRYLGGCFAEFGYYF